MKIRSFISDLTTKIKTRPLVWDTLTTTTFSTIGKGIGFLIPFFIAAWFGVSSEADAFFFSYGLILFLSGILAPVIENIIVPYIAEARSKREDVGAFVGQILVLTGLCLTVLTILLLLASKLFLGLITRFTLEELNLVRQILMEASPLVILLVWTSILAGTLNAYKLFRLPALSPAFRAVVVIGTVIVLKGIWGVHAIAVGYVLGEVFRLAIFLGTIYRLHIIRLNFSFNSRIWQFFRIALYQTIGMAAVSFSLVVDKIMASWIGKGSVSILEYANRLYMIPVTFLITGFSVVALSHWSEQYHEFREQEKFERSLFKTTLVIGIASFILTLFLFAFSKPLIGFIYGRGRFPQEDISKVSNVFNLYLVGLIPYVAGFPLSRGYLVMKKTAILMRIFLLNSVANVILNLVFMKYMGLPGISLSTSVISWSSLYLLWRAFTRSPERIGNKV